MQHLKIKTFKFKFELFCIASTSNGNSIVLKCINPINAFGQINLELIIRALYILNLVQRH